MATSRETESIPTRKYRTNANLITEEPKPNDHPLHLSISRKSALFLGVPENDKHVFLSLWTNTKVSQERLHLQTHPPGRSTGCIFQRMLSNSQNFPEILIPDTEGDDVDGMEDVTTGLDVEIFVCVEVKNELVDYEENEDIQLVCSSQFLTHYNIQSKTVFVRTVKLYPVNNVVLGVSNKDTFQWLTSKSFCSRLCKEVQNNSVLVRTKDVFLAGYGSFREDPDFKRSFYFDIFVLECSPVQQGVMTSKTEIVLTYLGDLAAENEHFQAKMENLVANQRQGERMISGPFKDIMISEFSHALNQSYLSPEIDPDESDSMPSFKRKPIARMQNKGQKTRGETVGQFEYDVVPQQPLFRRMLWRDEKIQNFDPLYYIGMSRKQMLKEGLFDSSYVLITPKYPNEDCDEESQCQKVQRLCMVRCLGKEYDRSKKLFISPLCLFNMVKKPPVELPVLLIMKVGTSLLSVIKSCCVQKTSQSNSLSLTSCVDCKVLNR